MKTLFNGKGKFLLTVLVLLCTVVLGCVIFACVNLCAEKNQISSEEKANTIEVPDLKITSTALSVVDLPVFERPNVNGNIGFGECFVSVSYIFVTGRTFDFYFDIAQSFDDYTLYYNFENFSAPSGGSFGSANVFYENNRYRIRLQNFKLGTYSFYISCEAENMSGDLFPINFVNGNSSVQMRISITPDFIGIDNTRYEFSYGGGDEYIHLVGSSRGITYGLEIGTMVEVYGKAIDEGLLSIGGNCNLKVNKVDKISYPTRSEFYLRAINGFSMLSTRCEIFIKPRYEVELTQLSESFTYSPDSKHTFSFYTLQGRGVNYVLPSGWSISGSTVTIPKGTRAGTYTITAKLQETASWIDITSPDEDKILWDDRKDRITTVTISKANPTLNVSGVKTTYTYTGSLQTINSGATVNNTEQTITYSNNTFTTVAQGNGKVVTISVAASTNYNAVSKTVTLTVNKASYNMSGVRWNYTSAFTYDGSAKTITLTGLPSGVTPNYSNNSKTNAGTYSASVTFSYDTANYNAPSAVSNCAWVINKANPVTAASVVLYRQQAFNRRNFG